MMVLAGAIERESSMSPSRRDFMKLIAGDAMSLAGYPPTVDRRSEGGGSMITETNPFDCQEIGTASAR